MKKSFFLPLAFLFPNYFMWSQTIFPFNELLKKIEIEPHEKRDKMIEHYLLDIGKTPIVEKEKVIFLAKGGMNDAPILLADFNGFMNARYVQDTFLSNMQNIKGTNWYFREKELNPDAIVICF